MANEEEEESRVVAAKLFNSLAPNIGRELCEIYVVPTIASFAEDTNSKVRKAVASTFLEMCKSISAETFRRKIIPVYEKLSYDSLWIVRKTAASIIYLISVFIFFSFKVLNKSAGVRYHSSISITILLLL